MSPRKSNRARTPSAHISQEEDEPAGGYSRFTRASAGGKRLMELFTSKLLDGSENPMEIYTQYPTFPKNNPMRFCNHFKKYYNDYKNLNGKFLRAT